MKTKYCPNCGSQIKVNSEHSILAICSICKKCVSPIDNFIKPIQAQFVQCPKWKDCNIYEDCDHKQLHEKFEDCDNECIDNRFGEGIIITEESCK